MTTLPVSQVNRDKREIVKRQTSVSMLYDMVLKGETY